MLMHADDRRVDHLHGRVMSHGPKLSGRSRHSAPDRKTQKMPLRTRRSFTRGRPRGLLGSIGLMTVPLIVGEFVAHDSAPSVRGMNHGSTVRLNWSLCTRNRTSYTHSEFRRSCHPNSGMGCR